MSESKHTPGPWEYNDPEKYKQVRGHFSDVAVYAPGNAFPWRMAEIDGPDEETQIANARLIAAAPDFRAVAVAVLDWWEEHRYDTAGEHGEYNVYDEEPEMVVLARAALAKAGEVKP